MESKFEKLKAELLLKAKNNNACESGYRQAEKCKTENELAQVIADNFNWVWSSKTITLEDLNKLDSELLQSVGIFANYEGRIESDINRLIIVGTSSTAIVTNDLSSPRIVTYDSSSPRIVTNDSSSPRIETYGSSSPRIVTNGSSSPRIVTNDSSSPAIVTNDSSSPRIVTYDSSSPRIVTYGSSSPRISGIMNCIINGNHSLIIDLDNLLIIKSENWTVK